MRVAVVGHVEWVEFLRVDHMPSIGEIVHARESWSVPAGGGAVAAVVLARATGECTLFTALGDDELGRRALAELEALGVTVEATFWPTPQRRAVTHIDAAGERTITVVGDRLGPRASDPLGWDALHGADAVYFTAGDTGAVAAARSARVLVGTARALDVLAAAAVPVDAIVASAGDPAERYGPGDLDPPPRVAVWTEGAAGGSYSVSGATRRRFAPVPPPQPVADTYGAGDSFAAGLTWALGRGDGIAAAVEVAARWGADALGRRGPFDDGLSG